MFELVLTMPRTGSTYYVEKQAKELQLVNHGELFHTDTKHHTLDILNNTNFENCIVKIFPSHIRNSSYKNLMEDLFAMNPSVTILLRKNFIDCTKSFYLARHLSSKSKRVIKDYNPFSELYLDPWHSSWETPIQINTNQDLMDSYAKSRAEEIKTLGLYKNKMNKLIFTEDFPQELKYKRPVQWQPEPHIKDIDVQELFYSK